MRARKVLVVDDDDVIREVAKVALEVVGGWHVITAVNGPDASELARDGAPRRGAARRDDARHGRPAHGRVSARTIRSPERFR